MDPDKLSGVFGGALRRNSSKRNPSDADKIVAQFKANGLSEDEALKKALTLINALESERKYGIGGAVKKAAQAAKAAAKAAEKPAFSQKVLESTAEKLAEKISKSNPKLSEEEVAKKALKQAETKLKWERSEKPELEKRYGKLERAAFSEPLAKRQRNVPEEVEARAAKAESFLAQPTEPWVPPPPELQAFDRARIKDALEGFPGIEQTKFPRYEPKRAGLDYIDEIYEDPRNRALIKKQIERGLPLGGETFYASLYPLKLAALERGIPEEQFNSFVYSIAPASARNSIMNEVAVGQFLRDMKSRGLPLDEDTVRKEMDLFREKYGIGLPLMPVHRQGVQNVLEGNQDLREMLKADIPTNYKIPTYGTQKAGDFGKSVVLDVHEAAGETQASKYHPYFTEQGGFGPTEYGTAENKMLDIAGEMGIPGGMAQAGRWFGGGELTGLKSPRGDALDLLEKQAAYTLQGQGINPTPRAVRNYILDMVETGRGVMMPWFKGAPMPDVRTVKKKGGLVQAFGGALTGKKAGGAVEEQGFSVGGIAKLAKGAKAASKAAAKAPQEAALETARKNAVKMLGLPENNTAMDRAKALGFDVDAFHGTTGDVRNFDPKMRGSNTNQAGSAMRADWATNRPDTAAGYADLSAKRKLTQTLVQWNKAMDRGQFDQADALLAKAEQLESAANTGGQNVMPLLLRDRFKNHMANGKTYTELSDGGMSAILDAAKAEGKGGVRFIGLRDDAAGFGGGNMATHYGIMDPSLIRSRFAAFDPARVHENDLLGRADPSLLAAIATGGGGLAVLGMNKNKEKGKKK